MSEIAPKAVRGAIVAGYQWAITLGRGARTQATGVIVHTNPAHPHSRIPPPASTPASTPVILHFSPPPLTVGHYPPHVSPDTPSLLQYLGHPWKVAPFSKIAPRLQLTTCPREHRGRHTGLRGCGFGAQFAGNKTCCFKGAG
jgi:hypothetical protein